MSYAAMPGLPARLTQAAFFLDLIDALGDEVRRRGKSAVLSGSWAATNEELGETYRRLYPDICEILEFADWMSGT